MNAESVKRFAQALLLLREDRHSAIQVLLDSAQRGTRANVLLNQEAEHGAPEQSA